MVWKWHQKMPVTWYTFKWHPTCQTPCQDYPVLQDSKVRLKGHNESWQCSVCLNGLKLSGPIQNTFLSTLKTILMVSGTILSSKTPGSDFEDIGSLDGLFAVQSWWNLQYWFTSPADARIPYSIGDAEFENSFKLKPFTVYSQHKVLYEKCNISF